MRKGSIKRPAEAKEPIIHIVDDAEVPSIASAFASPMLLYTYDGSKRIVVKSVYKYAIQGEHFEKTDVLFASPASKLDDVKSDIKIQKSVREQDLWTPKRIEDRPLVVSDEQLCQDTSRRDRLLMRSGHVLRGEFVFVSKHTLFLRIAGKMFLVYRHGLLPYAMHENALCRRNRRDALSVDPRALRGSSCGDSKVYLCVLSSEVGGSCT